MRHKGSTSSSTSSYWTTPPGSPSAPAIRGASVIGFTVLCLSVCSLSDPQKFVFQNHFIPYLLYILGILGTRRVVLWHSLFIFPKKNTQIQKTKFQIRYNTIMYGTVLYYSSNHVNMACLLLLSCLLSLSCPYIL